MAQAARLEQPLDVFFREQVVEAVRLVALDDERPAFPVLVEEPIFLDGLEATT